MSLNIFVIQHLTHSTNVLQYIRNYQEKERIHLNARQSNRHSKEGRSFSLVFMVSPSTKVIYSPGSVRYGQESDWNRFIVHRAYPLVLFYQHYPNLRLQSLGFGEIRPNLLRGEVEVLIFQNSARLAPNQFSNVLLENFRGGGFDHFRLKTPLFRPGSMKISLEA